MISRAAHPGSDLPVQILSFFLPPRLPAATSYLLIQGDFGGVSTTYKWEFIYNPGQISNGQDMLNLVFGTPSKNLAQPIYTLETGSLRRPRGVRHGTKGHTSGGLSQLRLWPPGGILHGQFSESRAGHRLGIPAGSITTRAARTVGRPPMTTAFGTSPTPALTVVGWPLSDGSYDGWVFGTNDFSDQTAAIAGSDGTTSTSLANDPLASSFSSGVTVINLTTALAGRAHASGLWRTLCTFLRRRRKVPTPTSAGRK